MSAWTCTTSCFRVGLPPHIVDAGTMPSRTPAILMDAQEGVLGDYYSACPILPPRPPPSCLKRGWYTFPNFYAALHEEGSWFN